MSVVVRVCLTLSTFRTFTTQADLQLLRRDLICWRLWYKEKTDIYLSSEQFAGRETDSEQTGCRSGGPERESELALRQ